MLQNQKSFIPLNPAKRERQNRHPTGFTLLELLVVIAIIAILAGVVIASVVDLRQRAKESKGMQFSQNIRTTLSNELLGEWTFDEEANPGKDSSGEGNNGTLLPVASPPQWTDGGKVRGALIFDGLDDYVEVSDQPYFRNITQSFSFWFRSPSIFTTFGGLIAHTNSADGYNILQVSNGSIRAYRRISGNWRYVQSFSSVTDNNWHHGVAVYDNTTIKFYIDTVLQGTDTYASPTIFFNTNYLIGRYPTSYYFKGNIDEIQIYKTALTAREIQQLYAESSSRHLTDK